MTRVQVLDVGDKVKVQLSWFDDESIVLKRHPSSGRYLVFSPINSQEGWLPREDLTRIGGDLQVGDFVRVSGGVCSRGSTTPVAVDWVAALIQGNFKDVFYIAPLHRTVLFEAHRVVLTRITRAEALA